MSNAGFSLKENCVTVRLNDSFSIWFLTMGTFGGVIGVFYTLHDKPEFQRAIEHPSSIIFWIIALLIAVIAAVACKFYLSVQIVFDARQKTVSWKRPFYNVTMPMSAYSPPRIVTSGSRRAWYALSYQTDPYGHGTRITPRFNIGKNKSGLAIFEQLFLPQLNAMFAGKYYTATTAAPAPPPPVPSIPPIADAIGRMFFYEASDMGLHHRLRRSSLRYVPPLLTLILFLTIFLTYIVPAIPANPHLFASLCFAIIPLGWLLFVSYSVNFDTRQRIISCKYGWGAWSRKFSYDDFVRYNIVRTKHWTGIYMNSRVEILYKTTSGRLKCVPLMDFFITTEIPKLLNETSLILQDTVSVSRSESTSNMGL